MEMEDRITLLLYVVRKKFLHRDPDVHRTAIVTAIEGLKWLAGEESVVTEEWLREFSG